MMRALRLHGDRDLRLENIAPPPPPAALLDEPAQAQEGQSRHQRPRKLLHEVAQIALNDPFSPSRIKSLQDFLL